MENEDLYRNLVILLKMFKNRPYHLAKYLIENSALSPEFIKKVSENGKLTNLSEEEDDKSKQPIYFLDIGKMNDYYSSFTDDIKLLEKGKTPSEIEKDLNEKLDKLLLDEKYEDAARVRDYMVKNKIKRIK
jgi:hypothetical protein